jgi:hypothetical protein
MTQTTFAPPPVFAAPEESTEGGSSRRPLILVGGLVAALALGGGGYVLLSGGGSSDDLGSGPFVPPHAKTATKPAAVKPAAAKPAVKVPVTSTVPLGRDPFHALYILPVAAAPASTTTGSGTNTAPATTTSTTSSTTTTPTTTTVKPTVYKLVLTKVSGSGSNLTATFTVAGKLMVAKVGSVFGPTSELKMLSLGQNAKGVWVATIQVGDSEPVDATKGETLYVR